MQASQPGSPKPLPASRFYNIGDWPAHWAQLKGDSPAVEDADRSLDWTQFADRVDRVADWLVAEGLRPGDRVAILLRNRIAFLELIFGAARMGGIGLPINLRLTAPEIAFQIDDCRPRAIFFESDLREEVSAALRACTHSPALRIGVGGREDEYEARPSGGSTRSGAHPASPEDPALLMYTSGTTGKPKGALLPHRKALFNALNAVRYFGIREHDRVLIAAPLFHSLGLQILALPILYAGGSVLLHTRFDPEAVWDAVDGHGIRYFGGVPAMHQRLYETLAARPPKSWDLSRLRFIFSAGSAISRDLIENFRERGLTLLQGYGQTETSILSCLTQRDWIAGAGTVGRPVRHAEIRVVELASLSSDPQTWRDAPAGATGEIVARGPINMIGYWECREATENTLVEGWIRTGDLGHFDSENFLTLTGRVHEMLISGGENVYPAEIEAVYREHPAVREIAVIGVADDRWGEVGRAHILLEPGATISQEALEEWGRERLAAFKIPRQFVFESALPQTASGKIKKYVLKEAAPDNPSY